MTQYRQCLSQSLGLIVRNYQAQSMVQFRYQNLELPYSRSLHFPRRKHRLLVEYYAQLESRHPLLFSSISQVKPLSLQELLRVIKIKKDEFESNYTNN
mgnify:CR=1 FL=1